MKHITIAALSVSLALFTLGPVAAATTTTTTTPDESTISLSASGRITRAPDLATLQMVIDSTAETAARATLDNNNRYNDLVGKLLAIGLARDAVKTIAYSLNTNLDGTKKSFSVNRVMTIRVENLDAVGKTIDSGIAANVSSVGGVTYGLRDPQAAYRAALAEAMGTALANARVLADAGHERIVRIKSIVTYAPIAQQQFQAMARSAAAAPVPQLPTEVLPTDLAVNAQVTVVFIIAP